MPKILPEPVASHQDDAHEDTLHDESDSSNDVSSANDEWSEMIATADNYY